MAETLGKPQICVKIMVYKGSQVDQVVYYRNKLPMWIIDQWRWFFEYLAARIKVAHPRRKVELVICAQTLLQGEEYIQAKTASLLRAKRSRLKKLQNEPVAVDLFGFGQQERGGKENALEAEIQALESGEFNYYVPQTYINNIKELI
ncbi:MAG: hypothetical protein K6E94_00570 [Elusimicrobiaceae bacterium]|nr:hypothetical protein [Elusimicrobiaceae bacterium]